jgi:hypothetical protein
MTLTELGMNLSKLSNMTALNLNISSNPTTLINDIVLASAVYTDNLIAYFIVLGIVIITYMTLSDKTQFADFGYSDARALCLAFAISTIIILTEIQAGFISNFIAITFSAFLFLGSFIFIVAYENKE